MGIEQKLDDIGQPVTSSNEEDFSDDSSSLETDTGEVDPDEEWQKVMERIFGGDRITMTEETRKKHQSGPEWLAHLARERERKSKKRSE